MVYNRWLIITETFFSICFRTRTYRLTSTKICNFFLQFRININQNPAYISRIDKINQYKDDCSLATDNFKYTPYTRFSSHTLGPRHLVYNIFYIFRNKCCIIVGISSNIISIINDCSC